VDKKLLTEFTKVRGKKTLQFKEDSDLTEYLQLYNDLAE
jgi:starch synthase